ASPLFNGSLPYPDWTNKVETPGYGTELVSKTYDRSKWERARKASEEALALAVGDGQRALYQGSSAETANMVKVSYFPVDNLDENFIRKVLIMRNVVLAKESEGNYEHIWASVHNTSGLVSVYRHRIPRNIINKQKGGTADYKSGLCCQGLGLTFTHTFLTRNGMQPTNDPDFTPESNWFKSAGFKDDGTKLRSHIINLFVNREPRFYAWVSFDGGDYGTLLYAGQRPVYVNMLSTADAGYDPANPRDYCVTGIPNQKWIDPKANISTAAKENFMYPPRPLIRLAELYLNLAECNAELGNTQAALDNINTIRRRAGAAELTLDKVTRSGKTLVEWAR
ncbi:MAG: RagB/SusD family nutrient uptake outer membrane protein, partial [Muribaculaceae bacterium]|nr:RagB/SusD family nutrient uptake outer membrane protein [Muribaculaceae bacterium]